MEKTHWKNMKKSPYLGAYSLEDNVEDVTLTIKKVVVENVKSENGKEDECIVAYFEEENVDGVIVKPMILNSTNCKIITSLYKSGFVEDWYGKKIIVYVSETKMGRERVQCLRIKKEIPKEEEYFCEVCGTLVEKKLALGVKKKYGAVLCGADCLKKYQNNENNENEEKGE